LLNFGKSQRDAETEVDAFLGQKIVLPQLFLKPAEGETHFRVYGHVEYAEERKELLDRATRGKEPFWSGKVFLKVVPAPRPQTVDSLVVQVIHENIAIGEISEFDSVARNFFQFEEGETYVARAVIRADLIGNLIHLFVNPANRI
jgi:hypothetical protein